MTFLHHWLFNIRCVQFSVYDLMLFYNTSKGMSHRGFSRPKRTVRHIPGNEHFWVYGHWTWDHLQGNLQKNPRIGPFIPLLVPCVGLNMNIGRLKDDFGCKFPMSFNAQTISFCNLWELQSSGLANSKLYCEWTPFSWASWQCDNHFLKHSLLSCVGVLTIS